jgi:hypothetical protein
MARDGQGESRWNEKITRLNPKIERNDYNLILIPMYSAVSPIMSSHLLVLLPN